MYLIDKYIRIIYCLARVAMLVMLAFCSVHPVFAQKANWQNLDLKTDTVFGISTEKAYTELLKGKKAKTVIVAVIDAGVDTAHEDLKAALWHNPKEKAGNHKDNDHNGYANDVYGWNFIGSDKGNVHFDNSELTRQVRQSSPRFLGKDSSQIDARDMPAFRIWYKERADLKQQLREARSMTNNISSFKNVLDSILVKMGKQNPALDDFKSYEPKNANEKNVKANMVQFLQHDGDFDQFLTDKLEKELNHYREEADYHLNVNYDPRSIVGDDYFNSAQRYYGNNDVTGPDASHGTHVAGIIAADRNNGIGVKGVADNVRIMTIRVVPMGDERDKDIANAICYATDNGAKVINMSFGKGYSQDKKVFDDAIKYAMSKDVLIIHAAGNSNEDLDQKENYPNRNYADGSGAANAWIEVGASGWIDDETLKAGFSNYGKNTVDVFAPGEKILSTIPGSKYEAYDGTSMAAPVVAGLAALIREYYPKLSAVQVKEIILKSVVKVNHPVMVPKDKQKVQEAFFHLCRTGGIVNAYNALQMAEVYTVNQ